MKELPSLAKYFQTHAPEYGATVLLEQSYKYAGSITFPDGRVRYFKYNHIDVNTSGASEIAKDKDYTRFFLDNLGYKTIAGKTFYSDEWAGNIESDQTFDKAALYAESVGYPVYVKPNGSGMGYGVHMVHGPEDLEGAIQDAGLYDKIILIQKAVSGMTDVRIVVFNGEVVCAYLKYPPKIVGDGQSSVSNLIKKYITDLESMGRPVSIKSDDVRIIQYVRHQGVEMDDILEAGREVVFLPNSNLSMGATGVDITDTLSEEWKQWALELTQKMNLTRCGIDVFIADDMSGSVGEYVVLEINHSPGLAHYKTLNEKAAGRVENYYKNILDYLANE